MRWPEQSGWRVVHALVLVLARTVLLFGLGMRLLGPAIVGQDNLFAGGWSSVLLLFLLLGLLDVGLVFYGGLVKWGRVTMRELGFLSTTIGRDVGLGLLGFAACSIVYWIAVLISGATLAEGWAAVASFTFVQRVMFGLVAVFGAALVEEGIFRGYLQPTLVRRFGLVGGIVVGAILFDLMHLNFRPASLFAKFMFGVIFGALRGRDRSLIAPGIAHGLVWAVYGA